MTQVFTISSHIKLPSEIMTSFKFNFAALLIYGINIFCFLIIIIIEKGEFIAHSQL